MSKFSFVPAGSAPVIQVFGQAETILWDDDSQCVFFNDLPAGGGVPMHIHPNMDEACLVVSGKLKFVANEESVIASVGDYVHVGKGIPHAFVALEPTRLLWVCSPGGYSQFFTEVSQVPMTPEGPDFAVLGQIAERHGVVMVGPQPELSSEGSRGLAAAPLDLTMLPQVSGNGYTSYAPAIKQFGTAATIQAILDIGAQYLHNGEPPFQVGNISLEGGGDFPPHSEHKHGKHVDLRPIRKDGQLAPVTYTDPQYSREKTQLLVNNFRAHSNCSLIIFSDPEISGTEVRDDGVHHNHLHVEMKQ